MTVARPVSENEELGDPDAVPVPDSDSEVDVEVELTVPVKVICESPADEVDDPVISNSGAEEVVLAATPVVDEAAAPPKPGRKLGE